MRSPVFETEGATRVDVRAEAMINDAYLRVLHTSAHEQIVVMMLPPDDQTGEVLHEHMDQFIAVVDGVGEACVGEYSLPVRPGDLVFVEPGTRHNLVNRAALPLRLINVFAPPAYPAGTVLATKEAYLAAKPDPDLARTSIQYATRRAGPRLVWPIGEARTGI